MTLTVQPLIRANLARRSAVWPLGLLMVLHVWWGAWGMARLVRGFGSTHTGSLLAGVVFGMSGWVGARFFIGHYNLILVWAWIPWTMITVRYALAHTGWAALLGATTAPRAETRPHLQAGTADAR